MTSFWNYLRGKKTYILAAAGAVVVGLYLAGVIDLETANILFGLLGFGAIGTMRSAISNGE